jgi:uncharacterized membrane protein
MNPEADVSAAGAGEALRPEEEIPVTALRPALLRYVRERRPDLLDRGSIPRRLLPTLQAGYVEESLEQEIGELTDLERSVIESLRAQEVISANPAEMESETRSPGDRVADRVAAFGGSWMFIIVSLTFLGAWILLNSIKGPAHAPDPYPFILLNLLLSCVAAFQAPIIMMSQRRQESRDRRRAEQDYLVNLKAELEIRHLHEKMDHLLHHHGQRLLEIQTIQTQLLRQLVEDRSDSAMPLTGQTNPG